MKTIRLATAIFLLTGFVLTLNPVLAQTSTTTPPVYRLYVSRLKQYSPRDTFHATTMYPRRALYYLYPYLTDDAAVRIARWDYAVLALENQYTSRPQLETIKRLNPNIRLAFYFPMNEANVEALENPNGSLHALAPLLDRDQDFLKKPDGSDVSFLPDAITYHLLRPNVWAAMVQFLTTEPDYSLWNDIFLDNVWSKVTYTPWVQSGVDSNRNGIADTPRIFNQKWINASIAFMRSLRKALPTDRRIVANMSEKNFSPTPLNGRMFEGFPNTLPSERFILQNYVANIPWRKPLTMIIHAEGNEDEWEKWNRAVTFTLLGDGYVAYDHGPVPNQGPVDTGRHDVLWWNEELYQSIGAAKSPRLYSSRMKMYVREFEQAVLLYNPTTVARTVIVQKRDASEVRVIVPPLNGRLVR